MIQFIREFFQKGDVLETLVLYFTERYELLLVVAAIIFILVLSLSVILQRLQKSSLIALVPVYRFVVIFKAIGIKSWYAFLMLVPGVNLLVRIYFYIVLVKKFNRNYGFVPLLILLPLIFLPIVAFGEGRCIYIDKAKRESKQRGQEKRLEQARRGQAMRSAAKEPEMTDEEIMRVLSMAEVRENRAQVRAEKEAVREARIPLAQPVAQKVARSVQTKDMMPMMKQGPMAQRNQIEKDVVYGRLLKQQEEEQRLRTQRRQRMVPNRSVIVEKPVAKAVPEKPAGHKKIDF